MDGDGASRTTTPGADAAGESKARHEPKNTACAHAQSRLLAPPLSQATDDMYVSMSRAVGQHHARSRSAPPARPNGLTSEQVHRYHEELAHVKKRCYGAAHGLNAHGSQLKKTVFGGHDASPIHRRASVGVRKAGAQFSNASGLTSEEIGNQFNVDGLGGRRRYAAGEPTGADTIIYWKEASASASRHAASDGLEGHAGRPQAACTAYDGALGKPSRSSQAEVAEAADGRRYSLVRPDMPLTQDPRGQTPSGNRQARVAAGAAPVG